MDHAVEPITENHLSKIRTQSLLIKAKYFENQLMHPPAIKRPLVRTSRESFSALQKHICGVIAHNNYYLANHSYERHRRNDTVVKASASQSVDLGFISPSSVIPKTLKMVFTASLLGAQHKRNSAENKPASLLVVSLGKALNGMPPSLCDKQMVKLSTLPVVVAQFN